MTQLPGELAISETGLVRAPAYHVTLAGSGRFLQEDVGPQVAQVPQVIVDFRYATPRR